jgi:hypothetical protein
LVTVTVAFWTTFPVASVTTPVTPEFMACALTATLKDKSIAQLAKASRNFLLFIITEVSSSLSFFVLPKEQGKCRWNFRGKKYSVYLK